jgi:hypothetical protein
MKGYELSFAKKGQNKKIKTNPFYLTHSLSNRYQFSKWVRFIAIAPSIPSCSASTQRYQ